MYKIARGEYPKLGLLRFDSKAVRDIAEAVCAKSTVYEKLKATRAVMEAGGRKTVKQTIPDVEEKYG